MDTMTNVEKVNAILQAGEPGNITKADTNGYVGYEPQSIIDAMNEGFGIGNWGFEEMSSETMDNEKGTLAVAHISVWLAGCDFKPSAWGQSRVTRGDTGDAKKGAQTDAIKKGLAYFSIGNRAYHGLLDGKKQTPAPRPQAQPRPAIAAVPAQPQDEPVIESLKQVINSARNRAYKLGLFKTVGDYERYCQNLIGKNAPETLADVNALNADMAQREKKAS